MFQAYTRISVLTGRELRTRPAKTKLPRSTRALRPAATPHGWAYCLFTFSTLRVWLRRGRDFTAADRMSAPPVAIVSASLTGQVWPGEDPLSRLDCRIRDGGSVPA